jgi:membrane protein
MTRPAVPQAPKVAGVTEDAEKPGFLDRLRKRMPWLDHVVRAQQRFTDSKGDFFAAGITYFTVFAMFPLLMLGFATGGFILARSPETLAMIEGKIRETIHGQLGEQVVDLMDAALASRTSVGVVGLATAAWAGLGWMENLREALTQMWGHNRGRRPGFVKRKLSDLLALLSAFVAILVTIAMTAIGNASVLHKVLNWLGIRDSAALSALLHIASMAVSVLVSWLLFTWMIARLPRESSSLRSCIRAGLMAAIGFELFKQVGAVYLRSVVTGPAGATFGPVLGLMVLAYVTARLVLFATAWAATSKENLREEVVEPPPPAVINSRVITRPGLAPVQAAGAAAAGAISALVWGALRRRHR